MTRLWGHLKMLQPLGMEGAKQVGWRERRKLKPRVSSICLSSSEVQQLFKPVVLSKSVLAGRGRGWWNVPRKNRGEQVRRPKWQKSCRIPVRASHRPRSLLRL